MWHDITFKVSIDQDVVDYASREEIYDVIERMFDDVDTEWEQLYKSIPKKFKRIAISYTLSPITCTVLGINVKAERTYTVTYSHRDEEKVQAYLMGDVKDNLERNIGFNTYDLFGDLLFFNVQAKIRMSWSRLSSSSQRSSSSRRSSSSQRSSSSKRRKLENIFSPRPLPSRRSSSSTRGTRKRRH